MHDNDDTYLACAMQGLVTEWDGRMGVILTDEGERITLNGALLRINGFKNLPKIGDRVHFWAEEQVKVIYKLREIRAIEPRQRDDAAIARLEKVYRDHTLELRVKQDGYAVETRTGIIESFDTKEGSGLIRLDDGALAEISPKGVRKPDYKRIKPGTLVRFRAVHIVNHCLASEIELLTT